MGAKVSGKFTCRPSGWKEVEISVHNAEGYVEEIPVLTWGGGWTDAVCLSRAFSNLRSVMDA